MVDFHTGGLNGMDVDRSVWQTEQWMEGSGDGGRCQWRGDWLSGWGWQSWQSWGWQLQQTWTGTEAEVASVEPNSHRGQRKKALLSVEEEGRVSVEGSTHTASFPHVSHSLFLPQSGPNRNCQALSWKIKSNTTSQTVKLTQ